MIWTFFSTARSNSTSTPAFYLSYSDLSTLMGRNLFILAATLVLFALVSCGLAYTNIAQQPGSPGDAALWRTMGLALFVIALLVSLAGVLSSLFEQAERRASHQRRLRRDRP